MLLFNQKCWGRFARKDWLVKGDRNSSYFQRRANIHRKKQEITKLKDDAGIWIYEPRDIAQKILLDYTEHFKSLYRTPRTIHALGLPCLISQEDNEQLTRLPATEEIKKAVFDINPSKTPGSDSFSTEFFQHYRELVERELIECIKIFFLHGKLLKEINHTFITLVPKNAQPHMTSHFHPISLCSTIYKIISKILASRLRLLLDKLVSPFQSTFIPGRSIHDNILITHESMHKFKMAKGKTMWIAIKLDMKKAYDELEWDFLFACLAQLGFHTR